LNQHHWLAERMRREDMDFQQCTNAFLDCRNAARPQELADSPGTRDLLIFQRRAAVDEMEQRLRDANRTIGQPKKSPSSSDAGSPRKTRGSLYAGLAPGYVPLDQLNVQVPPSTSTLSEAQGDYRALRFARNDGKPLASFDRTVTFGQAILGSGGWHTSSRNLCVSAAPPCGSSGS
jgi:hypothetical protein